MSDDNIIAFPSPPPEGGELPLLLAGGPLTCCRCEAAMRPATWHVNQDGTVCPACATQDPQLRVWQSLCDIYDRIDALMVAAEDAEQRTLLASLIAEEAQHFAQWRYEITQGDQS